VKVENKITRMMQSSIGYLNSLLYKTNQSNDPAFIHVLDCVVCCHVFISHHF
jgi:hypothetical protein